MFGTAIAIAPDIFYMCVCVYIIFYKEHFTMKEETLLRLLSRKFCPLLFPPLDEKRQETPTVCLHEGVGITTRERNAPWTPQYLKYFSPSLWS